MLAVVVVIGILGLLALTEQGRTYAVFLGRGMGNLLGYVLKFQIGKSFNFESEINAEALYGQSFSLSDSSLKIYGSSSSMKIGGNVFTLSDGVVEMEMTGNGDFVFTSDGKVTLNLDAKTLQMNGISTNNVKVEGEVTPTAFSLEGVNKDSMNITSASGKVTRTFDSTTVTANFPKSNLLIDNFLGTVELVNQTIKLLGTATGIEVNGRSI